MDNHDGIVTALFKSPIRKVKDTQNDNKRDEYMEEDKNETKNETKNDDQDKKKFISISALAAESARERLAVMRSITPAPTQSELIRTMHCLRLYSPRLQYQNTLNPNSKLHSKNDIHENSLGQNNTSSTMTSIQKQMTIDIYLDTCDALGIVAEPLILGILEKEKKLNNTIESLKKEDHKLNLSKTSVTTTIQLSKLYASFRSC